MNLTLDQLIRALGKVKELWPNATLQPDTWCHVLKVEAGGIHVGWIDFNFGSVTDIITGRFYEQKDMTPLYLVGTGAMAPRPRASVYPDPADSWGLGELVP